MKNKTKGKGSKAPLIVAVACMAVVGGLAAYIARSPAKTVPADQRRVEQQVSPKDVKVYTPSYSDKGDLKLDPKTEPVAKNQDAHVEAVNRYLDQLKMVPKDARALTCQISGTVATLDFSPAFETTYGTEDEQTVLKGVLTAMGQFKDVKQVKFTVAGRTLDTLGNVDLTVPQDVLREGESGN